jgi:hypothetical protein
MFSDNAHKVYLNDFEFDTGDKFRYEYNFFEFWTVDIRIEKIVVVPFLEKFKYKAKGNNMPGASKYDEIEILNSCIESMGSLYSNYDTIDEVDDDKLREVLNKHSEELAAVRFFPKLMERRLNEELNM